MNSISFVIPSYNNLRYLKNAYRSIRKYAGPSHEIIILDDASVDGTVTWLRSLNDENLVIWENTTGKRLGHTVTYNIGGKLAKNDIFGILHADMFIGPNYVENIMKHIKLGVVVSATRIEPPLHPEGKEKIVKDFGIWPETFTENEFVSFVQKEQIERANQTTKGIFAPWFIHKEDFLKIGGHDVLFAPFPYEDSDIFQRFILAGYDIIQSRDSLVYHLTCRGHKWTDDRQIGRVDDSFTVAEQNARINYLRKWNSWIKNDEYHYPILPKKYDTCLVLTNLNDIRYLELLEPWFGKVVVDNKQIATSYIEREQTKTILNMNTRVFTEESTLTSADVRVIIDIPKFGNEDFINVQKLSDILSELETDGEVSGVYELGNLRVEVTKLENVVDKLINC